MSKGTKFERDICKRLSLWWTDGKRTDVFWRTSGSGARATTRSKQDKDTFGQYGDVCATDPIGLPLIHLCTIEIKVGYSRQTVFDLVDRLPSERKQPYKKFINQAIQGAEQSGSLFWMLITKRRYKETLIIIPLSLYIQLKMMMNPPIKIHKAVPSFKLTFNLHKGRNCRIYCTTLSNFLASVHPDVIKDLTNE